MPNLTVRNTPKERCTVLKRHARRNRRSLNAEVPAMLAHKAEMAQRGARAAKAMKELDGMRAEIARKYPNQPGSVELIRQDRDAR